MKAFLILAVALACVLAAPLVVGAVAALARRGRALGAWALVAPLLAVALIVAPQALFFGLIARQPAHVHYRARPTTVGYRGATGSFGLPVPVTATANECYVDSTRESQVQMPLGVVPSVTDLTSLAVAGRSLPGPDYRQIVAVMRRALAAPGGVSAGWAPFVGGRLVTEGYGASGLPPDAAKRAMRLGWAVGRSNDPEIPQAQYAAWRVSSTLVRFVAVSRLTPAQLEATPSGGGGSYVYNQDPPALELPDGSWGNAVVIADVVSADFGVPSASALFSLWRARSTLPSQPWLRMVKVANAMVGGGAYPGVGEGFVPFRDGSPKGYGAPTALPSLPEKIALRAWRRGWWVGTLTLHGVPGARLAAWRASPALVRYLYSLPEAPFTVSSTTPAIARGTLWRIWLWMTGASLAAVAACLVIDRRAFGPRAGRGARPVEP